ncbi:cupin domain-containing protein, partial [Enterococcus casseliflavus]|nr:cupin domain-containing protein [Enterococcus casseliflavus]
MWQHLFIEGRRAVTGDGERPRYGLAFKKIFANGSKGIEQRAGLQADATVHNPRPLIQRIAGAVGPMHNHPHEQLTYVLSGEFEFTIGEETRVVSAGDTLY